MHMCLLHVLCFGVALVPLNLNLGKNSMVRLVNYTCISAFVLFDCVGFVGHIFFAFSI
jgi:hypothetical protein